MWSWSLIWEKGRRTDSRNWTSAFDGSTSSGKLTYGKDLGPEMDPLLGRFRDQLDLVIDVKLGFISQHP